MDFYFLLTLLFLFLISTSLGSFLSALTYRYVRGIDFISGHSFCDNCGRKLKWYLNIPLLSFVFLRGKSFCCNKAISLRYPIIELVTFLVFTLFFFNSSPFSYYIIFLVTFVILIVDLEVQIIPDEFSWLIILIALFMIPSGNLYSYLFSGFFSAFLLLILNLITKGRGMGLGDVKLAIGLGMFFNMDKPFYWLAISFIIGGIVSAILLILKKAHLKSKIAFGPFLIIGYWCFLLFFK